MGTGRPKPLGPRAGKKPEDAESTPFPAPPQPAPALLLLLLLLLFFLPARRGAPGAPAEPRGPGAGRAEPLLPHPPGGGATSTGRGQGLRAPLQPLLRWDAGFWARGRLWGWPDKGTGRGGRRAPVGLGGEGWGTPPGYPRPARERKPRRKEGVLQRRRPSGLFRMAGKSEERIKLEKQTAATPRCFHPTLFNPPHLPQEPSFLHWTKKLS